MECGRRGYTKSSAVYEVQISKDDSYHSVIRKISGSIAIDDCEENELRLFNGRGGIIPDGCITVCDKEVDWSLGAFLLKRHTSADKLTLGIGIVDEKLEPVISVSKKAKVSSSTHMNTEPLRKAAADQNG
ncbi:PREDICTED: uncharacterized protein LOC109580782 [Amphimedon queenslandica]|uniref:Uncharacterized protein n=1 Tax=Amphimedon queenslandica TaxID=400682 RepID=A0AAN0IYP3_AMPQE|nr:PREDICTED: uncharacterized protein LOC109580782 [Amphimedon queenslandica]|eukprot:XP_019849884.1 PREDICTED: uncharacterized protein LOC109580782 [Amphimedon queenslandica]